VLRQVRSLETIHGFQLKPGKLLFFSDKADLALIEVQCENGLRPAEIASMEPGLGQPVYGVTYRPKGIVYVHCRILEIHPIFQKGKRFKTDCSCTHGSSGTGLFDQFGYLTAVLSASRPFEHIYDESLNEIFIDEESFDDEMMSSSTNFDWDRGKKKCIEAWSQNRYKINKTELEACFDLIRLNTKNTALNPRSQGEPAVHLLELPDKGKKCTLQVMSSVQSEPAPSKQSESNPVQGGIVSISKFDLFFYSIHALDSLQCTRRARRSRSAQTLATRRTSSFLKV
jgi:hypothetical protein